MHAKTLLATLELSSVEELQSAQQRIYVLSVACMSINDDVAAARIEKLPHDISNFQTSKRLSFPIIHPTNNGKCGNFVPPIILHRLIEALHSGNRKIILRKWKQGARWWNLNTNNHDDDTSPSSSTDAMTTNNDNNISSSYNTLSMARAEVGGYRLAKLAMHHHSQQQQHNNEQKRKKCAYVPDVLYFSHDENDAEESAPWALFSYFGKCTEGLDDGDRNDEINIDINTVNNSKFLKWDLKKAGTAVVKTTSSLQQHNQYLRECKHYPSTMTKNRHEFGFDEPHPRHGRVPIDECLDYAHMILRDVVLPIQFSFFEWSTSSSSSSSPSLSIQSSGNGPEWRHNLCALAVDSQKTAKPFQYHCMIAVYRLALQRLSTAHQHARGDDERMNALIQMMFKCVAALEHEWDDHDGRHPPPLPAVICHMDLQPQNLTFWHDRNDDANTNNVNIHVSEHCSVASVVDFEEAAYADPRFEILLISRKVLANIEQADKLWKSYSSSVKKFQTTWEVGPIEPWVRLETVHSLFTLLLQANNLLGGGRNPWETKPDLWGKIDRERLRLVKMGWSFCNVDAPDS